MSAGILSPFLSSLKSSELIRGVPPGSNTGGKFAAISSDHAGISVCIDTLTVSFDGSSFARDPRLFSKYLESFSNQSLTVGAPLSKRFNGYGSCWSLLPFDCSEQVELGWIGVSDSSDHMRGRWCIHLTAMGCSYITVSGGWHNFLKIQDFFAKITRCDIAVDDLSGSHSVTDAVLLYSEGAFSSGGRLPYSRMITSSHAKGDTFYVGSRANGKLCRIYEKGKQLGDPSSLWVRHELELRSKDRVIPFDVLVDPIPFFRGAYPVAYSWLPSFVSVKIPTKSRFRITFSRLHTHVSRQSGRFINYLLSFSDMSPSDIVDFLRDRRGLFPSSLSYLESISDDSLLCPS